MSSRTRIESFRFLTRMPPRMRSGRRQHPLICPDERTPQGRLPPDISLPIPSHKEAVNGAPTACTFSFPTCRSLRSIFLPLVCQRFEACACKHITTKTITRNRKPSEVLGKKALRNWFANCQTQTQCCHNSGSIVGPVRSLVSNFIERPLFLLTRWNVGQSRECHNAEFLLRQSSFLNSPGVWRFSPTFTLFRSSESRRRWEWPTRYPKI